MKGYLTFSVLVIVVCVCAVSCEKRIPNTDIVEEVRRCDASALVPEELRNTFGEIIGIQCRVPKARALQ